MQNSDHYISSANKNQIQKFFKIIGSSSSFGALWTHNNAPEIQQDI